MAEERSRLTAWFLLLVLAGGEQAEKITTPDVNSLAKFAVFFGQSSFWKGAG